MNRSHALLAVLLFTLAVPPPAVHSQTKSPRVGFVEPYSRTVEPVTFNAFVQGMKDLGYEEGRNVVYERRSADGKRSQFSEIAVELVAANVDVIVAATGSTALAAKRATSRIPIVMASSGDAVLQGIVASLQRPGGNVTGLTSLTSELAPKRLEVLKEIMPRLSKLAILWCPAAPINRLELGRTQETAKLLRLDLQLIEYDETTPDSWNSATKVLLKSRPDALFLLNCTTLPFQSIADYSLKHRLVTMSPNSFWTRTGGLVSYGPDLADSGRRAAAYVDKILKGTKPGDLPVEQPTKFSLSLNLKTAKAIGVTIQREMILRADHVIE